MGTVTGGVLSAPRVVGPGTGVHRTTPLDLVVLGASGRVGREVMRLGRYAGHRMTAFVRDPANRTARLPGVRVVAGTVEDPGALSAAVKGQDAVLVALGSGCGGRCASAPHAAPLSIGLRNVIRIMETRGVSRVLTVGDPRLLPPASIAGVGRLDTMGGAGGLDRDDDDAAPGACDDHRRAYDILLRSDLEWVMVCPVRLSGGPALGTYRIAIEALPAGGEIIRPPDVAEFMLTSLNVRAYARRRIGIAY